MITSTPAARRGRPRAFDREAALEKAMQAFWARGYDGTSMAQLVEAMGINSPSIYAAFGSKEGLFFEAVELYISSEVGPVWRVLEEAGDTASAIQAMLFALIDVFFATEPSRGCLIGLGAGYLGASDGVVQAFLHKQRGRLRKRLTARMRLGIEAGDIHPDSDPSVLAGCVLAYFSGLAVEALDGVTKPALRKSAALFCKSLFDA